MNGGRTDHPQLALRSCESHAPTRACGARVLVASHVRLYREGVARLLNAHGLRDITLVHATDLLVELRRNPPDIAIRDVAARSARDPCS